MTNKYELNRLMAEMMGWDNPDTPPDRWQQEMDGTYFRFIHNKRCPICGDADACTEEWNPCGNIEQAFMCVEKMRENYIISIEADHNDYVCQIMNSGDGWIGDKSADTPALAIVEAIAQVIEEVVDE